MPGARPFDQLRAADGSKTVQLFLFEWTGRRPAKSRHSLGWLSAAPSIQPERVARDGLAAPPWSTPRAPLTRALTGGPMSMLVTPPEAPADAEEVKLSIVLCSGGPFKGTTSFELLRAYPEWRATQRGAR